jgi:hypothetical protein
MTRQGGLFVSGLISKLQSNVLGQAVQGEEQSIYLQGGPVCQTTQL